MEDENPFAPPQASLESTDFVIEGDPTVVRVDKKLRMPEGAQLPTRCVKCNRPAQNRWEVAVSDGLSSQSGVTAISFVMMGVILLMVFVFYDISFLWLIPLALFAVVIVWWMQRHEPRPIRTTFYSCPAHNNLRRLSVVPFIVVIPYLLDSLMVTKWMGVDRELVLKYPDMMYVVLLANLALVFAPRIVGKKLESGLYEFHGFGKRYLQSFPSAEEQATVSGEA